jgi:hypothetical protein
VTTYDDWKADTANREGSAPDGPPYTLECDHCGDVSLTATAFHDGDGGACESCGFPGRVSVDEDGTTWWNTSQDKGARCTLESCDECNAT